MCGHTAFNFICRIIENQSMKLILEYLYVYLYVHEYLYIYAMSYIFYI